MRRTIDIRELSLKLLLDPHIPSKEIRSSGSRSQHLIRSRCISRHCSCVDTQISYCKKRACALETEETHRGVLFSLHFAEDVATRWNKCRERKTAREKICSQSRLGRMNDSLFRKGTRLNRTCERMCDDSKKEKRKSCERKATKATKTFQEE